uniref:PRKR-interacting protein 1 homolog n=1 Tax=Onchocerca volvulus TaxID=6282 RepID=A0A8R1Y0A1_ONCVO
MEKPVSIPQRRDGRKPRPPPDFVRNVVGSSAAAGSAEFHIFRNNRKREMDRLDHMNNKALQEELDEKFLIERRKRKEEEERRTTKKRLKRQRYKQKMKNLRKKNEEKNLDETDEDDSGSSSVSERSKQNANEENKEIVGNSGIQNAKSEIQNIRKAEMEKISDPSLSVQDILENLVERGKDDT